jgi:hypothetical protein
VHKKRRMDIPAGALDNIASPNDLPRIPSSEPCHSKHNVAQSTGYSTRYERESHCADGNVCLLGDAYSQHNKNALDAMLPQEHSGNYPKLAAYSLDKQVSTIFSPNQSSWITYRHSSLI